jgi:hypothetical protein
MADRLTVAIRDGLLFRAVTLRSMVVFAVIYIVVQKRMCGFERE